MRSVIPKLREIYLSRITSGDIPAPRIIHVETRSRCNGLCAFCPASVRSDTRDDVTMSDDLIEKIIEELAEWDYSNRLSFYNNSEPFLYKRIYEVVALARERLPKAFLELKSNGKTLNTDKILRIFNAGLDCLYINDYSETGEHSQNIKKILHDLENIRRLKGVFSSEKYFRRVIVDLRKVNAVLGSRAGSSPNKPSPLKLKDRTCFRPCEMVTISPEGKVSVCSEDFHYDILIGDAKQQGLYDIWTSQAWNSMRKALLQGDRDYRETCSQCDYREFPYEMALENGLMKERKYRKSFGRRIQKIISPSRG